MMNILFFPNNSISNNVKSDDSCNFMIVSDWVPLGKHVSHIMERGIQFYGELKRYLENSDFNVVNIECVLSKKGTPIFKDGPNLRGDPKFIEHLSKCFFNIACLANNHSKDYGDVGLIDMINILNESGIKTVGAGGNSREAEEPLVLDVNNNKIAIINAAEGEASLSVNNGSGVANFLEPRITDQIKKAKQSGHFVIGVFHAGREYVPIPPPYIYEKYHEFVEAGADLIVGHHPHVFQGIEVYNNTPILYSLGNFVFLKNNRNTYQRLGFAAKCNVRSCKLDSIEILPYKILDYGLEILSGEEKRQFSSDLQELSSIVKDFSKVKEFWNGISDLFAPETILKGYVLLLTKKRLGAAILRNRFTTPAHIELLKNSLLRIERAERREPPLWVFDLLRKWNCDVSQGVLKKFFNFLKTYRLT